MEKRLTLSIFRYRPIGEKMPPPPPLHELKRQYTVVWVYMDSGILLRLFGGFDAGIRTFFFQFQPWMSHFLVNSDFPHGLFLPKIIATSERIVSMKYHIDFMVSNTFNNRIIITACHKCVARFSCKMSHFFQHFGRKSGHYSSVSCWYLTRNYCVTTPVACRLHSGSQQY